MAALFDPTRIILKKTAKSPHCLLGVVKRDRVGYAYCCVIEVASELVVELYFASVKGSVALVFRFILHCALYYTI